MIEHVVTYCASVNCKYNNVLYGLIKIIVRPPTKIVPIPIHLMQLILNEIMSFYNVKLL